MKDQIKTNRCKYLGYSSQNCFYLNCFDRCNVHVYFMHFQAFLQFEPIILIGACLTRCEGKNLSRSSFWVTRSNCWWNDCAFDQGLHNQLLNYYYLLRESNILLCINDAFWEMIIYNLFVSETWALWEYIKQYMILYCCEGSNKDK